MRDNKDICNQCEEVKPRVIRRQITPSLTIVCCSDCAMEKRRIQNESGKQKRADEQPYSNGKFTQ